MQRPPPHLLVVAPREAHRHALRHFLMAMPLPQAKLRRRERPAGGVQWTSTWRTLARRMHGGGVPFFSPDMVPDMVRFCFSGGGVSGRSMRRWDMTHHHANCDGERERAAPSRNIWDPFGITTAQSQSKGHRRWGWWHRQTPAQHDARLDRRSRQIHHWEADHAREHGGRELAQRDNRGLSHQGAARDDAHGDDNARLCVARAAGSPKGHASAGERGCTRATRAQANGVAQGPRERRRTGLHKGHASAGEQGCTSICSVDATRHSVSGAGLEGPLLARQRAAYTAHAVDDDARGVDAWQNGDESGEVGGLIKGFKRRAQSRREADRRDQLTPRRQSGRRREWRRRRRRREKWGWRWRRRRRRRRRRWRVRRWARRWL